MSWTWRYLNEAGTELRLSGPNTEFPSQADAETWLGEVWRTLADSGAAAVILLEDGREVYGPMSLRPD
jgi:hypothetical protein